MDNPLKNFLKHYRNKKMLKLITSDNTITANDIPDNFTGIVEFSDGNKAWYKNGLLHRENGPAIEWSDGNKFWYREGIIHRQNGPACEYYDGSKEWLLDGKLHREDGPAIECANGKKEWWINGKILKKRS